MFDWMTNKAGDSDVAPYLSAVGGGFGAVSSLLAGQQSAKLLRANAGIAGLQAQSENQAGAEQAELLRLRADQNIGKQRAEIGGSNLTVSGSTLRALQTTQQFSAQDIATLQTNSARKAWGYQTTQQGDLVRANEAESTGTMNSFGSLITSGARAFGQWSTPD